MMDHGQIGEAFSFTLVIAYAYVVNLRHSQVQFAQLALSRMMDGIYKRESR